MQQWPVDLQVTIKDEELKRTIARAERTLSDLTPMLKRSGVHMISSFDKNFKAQGRPQKWKPLAPNTVINRRKGSSVVLQDTGRLRMSVLSRVAPGNIYKLTKNSLRMGSALKVAAWHQYGTPPYLIRPKTKKFLRFQTTSGIVFTKLVRHPGLAARPFVLIHPADERAMTKIWAQYIDEQLGRN